MLKCLFSVLIPLQTYIYRLQKCYIKRTTVEGAIIQGLCRTFIDYFTSYRIFSCMYLYAHAYTCMQKEEKTLLYIDRGIVDEHACVEYDQHALL